MQPMHNVCYAKLLFEFVQKIYTLHAAYTYFQPNEFSPGV